MEKKGIFVTGTGTDIGKTYVSALLAKAFKDAGVNIGYYKAAVSGNSYKDGKLIPGDALFVNEFAGLDLDLEAAVPYVYERAYSPHLAAQIEGNPVELSKVKDGLSKSLANYDFVIMEGSGGILCPIRYDKEELWLEDIIALSGFSSVIVADAGLGTINHVLLTVHYMKSKGLPILGIIYNNYEKENILHEDNIYMIEKATNLPTLAKIAKEDTSVDIGLLQDVLKDSNII